MKREQKNTSVLTASKFIALPDSEKQRIYQEIDSMTEEQIRSEFRPLTAKERAEWRAIRKNMRRGRGRPQTGKGVRKVSVSVERTLLSQADKFAKRHKLNRSELFSRGVASFIAQQRGPINGSA